MFVDCIYRKVKVKNSSMGGEMFVVFFIPGGGGFVVNDPSIIKCSVAELI